MFINYLKLAIKVLGRRKFFTFISLFGISITLMILMVVIAFFDNELGSHSPASRQDQLTFIGHVSMRHTYLDTAYVRDTTMVNGVAQIDSTANFREINDRTSTSSGSYHLLNTYFRNVPFAVNSTIFFPEGVMDVIVNNKKMALATMHTDEHYWEIFDFHFIEGNPYKTSAVNNREQVIVITNNTRDRYFGTTESVLGKEIKMNEKHYRVIGVVEAVKSGKRFVKSDVYIPLTNIRSSLLKTQDILGSFEMAFLAEKSSHIPKIQNEIKSITQNIPLRDPDEYNILDIEANTFGEHYAQSLIYNEDASKSATYVLLIIGSLFALFILLPTLNLININVTRILERSSEIGVRKAFGASEGNLLAQFVFENVILTFLGGILGFILAWFMIGFLNDNNVFMGETELVFNTSAFFYSFLICIFFGVISGLIPAWRMSRLAIVNALKQS